MLINMTKNENILLVQRMGLTGITNFLLSFSGIILLPVLTKKISIEEYGYWVQIGVTVGMVTILAMLGLPFTLVRFLASLHKVDEILEVFYSMYFIELLISILVSSIFFIFSGKIALVLFGGNNLIVHIMAILIFIECMNSFLIGYLRAREQIKRYSILNLFKAILQITSISFLVLSGKGIIGAEVGLLFSSLSIFFVLNYVIVSEIGFKIPRFENIKDFLTFGIPTIPSNLSNWVVNASDRYVIGYYLGSASVGYYSPGYSLGNIINIFSAPVNFILPATLSRHYDNNNINEVKSILSNSLKYYLIIAIPSFFGLSFLSKPLLTILTTPEIASKGYLITPVVALGSLFFGIYAIYQKIIILEKKTMTTAKIWFIGAILNLVLNIIMIPYFGIISAAFTTLTAFALSLTLIMKETSAFLKPEFDYSLILKILFSSSVLPLIILSINPKNLPNIALSIFICVIIYSFILYFTNSFKRDELIFLKSIFSVK
ncbi:hypothetical protein MSSAC_2013 [Methanosarcina siciliae C2J]|uniref:Uncharacterized protein n=2 Tax=Methanosarcina siciliae TaxID=38027 RepID=A0A0E3PPV3_9EURY|nr:hypothetical protein MSSAC_2013 [Methanosarcina siciliae C2J]